MPVDVPEEEWDSLQIVFATSEGDVRRNALSDFTEIKRNGKIAMKLPEGVSLVNARIADESDDVMLVTRQGRAIRFSTTDVRVFKGRDSTGVRGVRLGTDDRVVSMAVIRHFDATPEERAAYLKQRRLIAGAVEDAAEDEDDTVEAGQLSTERYAEMSAAEDLILTITAGGLGKITSSHDYRITARGGQGVRASDAAMRGGPLVAAFPVEMSDQVMLVTSSGQSIRIPVEGIRFLSRAGGGVKVLNLNGSEEEVASVARIAESGDPAEDEPAA